MSIREFFDSLAPQWDDKLEKADFEKIEKIMNEIEIKEGNILDCGCGTGILHPFLVKKTGRGGSIFEMDFSFSMLHFAKKKKIKYLIQGEAESMPFVNAFFDNVIFMNVFPHFKNKKIVLKETYRILKDGGKVFILHTSRREEVNSFHKNYGGVIANDLLPEDHELISLLKETNFRNIKIKETDIFICSGEK